MRVLLVFLTCTLAMASCSSSCPQETNNMLNYGGSSSMTVNGVATGYKQELTMFLTDAFVLGTPLEPQLGQAVDLPAPSPDTDAPMLSMTGLPNALFTVLESKPLADLDGTELTVGQTFDDTRATATLDRWDLPTNDGFPVEQITPVTFHFQITDYAAPKLPKNLAEDDWKTKPFVTVTFDSDVAATPLGDAQVSGTVSYYLQRQTTADCPPTPCDQRLFGCN
jgi:hypothetical protein